MQLFDVLFDILSKDRVVVKMGSSPNNEQITHLRKGENCNTDEAETGSGEN